MNILLDYYMLTYDKNQHAAKISDFFIFEFKKKNVKHDYKQFANKNRNTLLNEYNENEFEQVYYELWAHEVFSSECYFHMLMNILLKYYMLTHNNNQHAIKISDFFIFKFKKEEFI